MDEKPMKKMVKQEYVVPCIEIYAAEACRLCQQSFYGGHKPGTGGNNDLDDDGGNHKPGIGGDGDLEAKRVILGQEFGFSDVWEN